MKKICGHIDIPPFQSLFFGASLVLVAPCASADPLLAFTTSTLGQGDMHNWPEVSGSNLNGLAAADGICQARATTANLPKADQFVAWLSDRNDDAYCRMYGLGGKKAANCGQLSLPHGARPWSRVDDAPFMDTLENALDSDVVYSQLNVDEFGTQFSLGSQPPYVPAEVWTATDIDGTFNTQFENDGDCLQWTSTAYPAGATPTLGSSFAAGGSWTFDGTGNGCGANHRLVCMQKGSGPALTGHSQFGHREAFVTSVNVTGNLGGLSGADGLCKSLASSANLDQPNSFKALLSSYTEGVNLTDRIQFDGPWYRLDGLLFAHSKSELTSGAITLPLNLTDDGKYLGDSTAFTGTTEEGTAISGFDCADWSVGSGGITNAAMTNVIAFAINSHNWASVAQTSCGGATDWPSRLICLSDSDVIFHHEFESAKTSR